MISHLSSELKQQMLTDMENLYHDLSEELSLLPAPCTSCGFCCHFDAAKHFLYVSTLEMVYLFDKYELNLHVKNREVCPFLSKNMCSVRDRRMLGCRTYFRLHNKQQTIASEEIYEQYLTKIKELHKKYSVQWEYQDCMNIFQERSKDLN
ncbi:YkgJ family cysteine cluster protein [Candidatus Uabimicrobium sp. HlEnr_7]|uniref:YkgJ family cysteine cluster protein n=1 Tax=Candidatus Uabimicrobium helgolandensis TaxID=3095367 RepID=UPI0035563740